MAQKGGKNTMKEFEDFELVIHRNKKWLKKYEKQGFFLSHKFPLKSFKLPKELKHLEEKHIPLLRATLKLHWEAFIVNVMNELRERPIPLTREKRTVKH